MGDASESAAHEAAPGTERQAIGSGARPAPGTLTQLFYEAVERYDRPDALQYKRDGKYRPISHRDLLTRVRHVGQGLLQQGLRAGDRVAILSENRPEWAIADYACLTVGLADVPLYPSLPAEQLMPMLYDSGAAAIFVSTAAQAAKVTAIRSRIPALRRVISFDEEPLPGVDLTLSELESVGAAEDATGAAQRYRDRALAVRPDDLATIIYTSGTTGEPKGVMLTHDNIFSNVAAARTVLPFFGTDVSLCFLPLSHIFGRMADHYLMFAVGASIAYVESMDTLMANLGEVRPTFMLAVPRVYEKVYANVLEQAHASPLRLRLFTWATGIAEEWASASLAGRPVDAWLSVRYGLARRLVFGRLRSRLGGRLRFFVSGGAPLAVEINRFFYAAGLTILEGYGLTETSPVITVNTPAHLRLGTVGQPMAGVEVRIADDGEILSRGPNVMRGYFNKPDETRAAVDADGWFHTGDIGELHDGFLTITDRKKELIKTAGGKFIAPAPLENRIRASPFVGQVVVIGDRRKYSVLLVVPNFDQLERWARANGLSWTTRAELVALPAALKKMEEETLGRLTGLASFEMPKRIGLLERELSIEAGELTPTLKVKRRVIEREYKALIDSLYPDSAPHSGAE
jgi:long-chain acyl-CoA synthetase